MEIESRLLFQELHCLFCRKQRKSPENGDWKSIIGIFMNLSSSWNKENLLKMEIERQVCWNFLHVNDFKKQRKSPENGDWKTPTLTPSNTKWSWNKENLLKMEIERIVQPCEPCLLRTKQRKSPENGDWKDSFAYAEGHQNASKQRKSPENGDWKETSSSSGSHSTHRNKENLLKMEIERQWYNGCRWGQLWTGNKENLLKMEIESVEFVKLFIVYVVGNKENLLKMEIESSVCYHYVYSSEKRKQRKSPENGDWKSSVSSLSLKIMCAKQRKSPENGDWKFYIFCTKFLYYWFETKKISWKWRLKDICKLFG